MEHGHRGLETLFLRWLRVRLGYEEARVVVKHQEPIALRFRRVR
jgi:hypothetical protein